MSSFIKAVSLDIIQTHFEIRFLFILVYLMCKCVENVKMYVCVL